MATVEEALALALQFHQAGNLRRAEQLYRDILQADPRHADSHHLLGLVAFQTGQHAQAVASIRQALTLSPSAVIYYSNLAAVYEAAQAASEHARSGQGPIILEMLTYRYRGHSMSDPAKYRTKEEVDKVRTEHDPIEQVRARLLAKKWASEDELKKIDAAVRAVVNEAAEFATNDPEPDPAELYTDVYR